MDPSLSPEEELESAKISTAATINATAPIANQAMLGIALKLSEALLDCPCDGSGIR